MTLFQLQKLNHDVCWMTILYKMKRFNEFSMPCKHLFFCKNITAQNLAYIEVQTH